MRTHHTQHSLQAFPIYSAAFVDDHKLVLGGGGGSSRSGIKNKLRLYEVPNDQELKLLSELELEKDEDAPMSMVAEPEGSRIICGINSSTEQLEKDVNENCRLFSIEKDKFNLTATRSTLTVTKDNLEECQKVTALSPGRTLTAVAGSKDMTVLSFPSLEPAAKPLRTHHEIYDVSFSAHSLIVTTTEELLVYDIPAAVVPTTSPPGPKTRNRQKQKQKDKEKARTEPELNDLLLLKIVDRPELPGNKGSSVFRAARYHPSTANVLFTVLNSSFTGPRTRGTKIPPKQGYILRWNTDNWEVTNVRKIGERGITCFDVSTNGKFLAYGAADHSIGILDANTLAPLFCVLKAHEFPPTVLRFNPSSTLLVSGSADNTVRAVVVPDNLAGTTWTTGSVVFMTLVALLFSILIAYVMSSDFLS